MNDIDPHKVHVRGSIVSFVILIGAIISGTAMGVSRLNRIESKQDRADELIVDMKTALGKLSPDDIVLRCASLVDARGSAVILDCYQFAVRGRLKCTRSSSP